MEVGGRVAVLAESVCMPHPPEIWGGGKKLLHGIVACPSGSSYTQFFTRMCVAGRGVFADFLGGREGRVMVAVTPLIVVSLTSQALSSSSPPDKHLLRRTFVICQVTVQHASGLRGVVNCYSLP